MEVKKLLGDRVLVKVEYPEPIAEGSKIIAPEQVKAAMIPTKGEVIAVGAGFLGIEMQVEVGDRVLFGKSSGYEDVNIFGKGNFVMKQSDILAVIDHDAIVNIK